MRQIHFLDLPQEVEILAQNSNQLLDDLRELNQLKNSQYQSDSELNSSKHKQSQITTKGNKLKR